MARTKFQSSRNDAFSDFIAAADAVPVEQAFAAGGWMLPGRGGHGRSGAEITGPCPACGGRDCFSIHPGRNLWNCRKGGVGGGSPVSMAAHFLGLDMKTREGLQRACETVLGRDFEGGHDPQESAELREARRRQAHEAVQKTAAARAEADNRYRKRARDRARRIWQAASPLSPRGPVASYLALRCGIGPSDVARLHLRENLQEPFWMEPAAPGGAGRMLFRSPAMVGAIVSADRRVIGAHLTWVEPGNGPKHRITRPHPDRPGEMLPAKKMRGSQMGGVIGLAGKWECARWVGGEGIENGLAWAVSEGFRDGTFYFAACSIHNMAGPGARHGAISHPSLKTETGKPMRLPTPIAAAEQPPAHETGIAMPLPAHVGELLLLADGDSEMFWTAAMMARCKARLTRPGLSVEIAWPPDGTDWAAHLMRGDQS